MSENINEKSFISLRHIDKVYDNNVQAVFDFNLDIMKNEFIVFVGPSGCGKSTTLRMIAGLESITRGELYIDGKLSNNIAPKNRDIAMVFQSYALYPHMTVYENMAYGLKIKHIPENQIKERVDKATKILQLENYLDKKPGQLSGGQCQRVALGRAIVRNAKVFLMDEPLSNLDAKLRIQMRSELSKLHEQLKTTTIYVTHDQIEAMTMASRIVVMKDGYIKQVGTPMEIYNKPDNIFVATFIGSPAMNILSVIYDNGVIKLENGLTINLSSEQVSKHDEFYKNELEKLLNKKEKDPCDDKLDEEIEKIKKIVNGTSHLIKLGIRPESVFVADNVNIKNISSPFEIDIKAAELLGQEYYIHALLGSEKLIAKIKATRSYKVDEKISLVFNLDKIYLFDPKTINFVA